MKKILLLILMTFLLMSCATTLYKTSDKNTAVDPKDKNWIHNKIFAIENENLDKDGIRFYKAISSDAFLLPKTKTNFISVFNLDLNVMLEDGLAEERAKSEFEGKIANYVIDLKKNNQNVITNEISRSIEVKTNSVTTHESINGESNDTLKQTSVSALSLSNLPADRFISFWQIVRRSRAYIITLYTYITLKEDEFQSLIE